MCTTKVKVVMHHYNLYSGMHAKTSSVIDREKKIINFIQFISSSARSTSYNIFYLLFNDNRATNFLEL